MSDPATGFWTTVRLLLRAARARTNGRARRQRELRRRKSGEPGDGLQTFAILGLAVVGVVVHGWFAFGLMRTATVCELTSGDREGRIPISKWNFERIFQEQKVAPRKGKSDREYAIESIAWDRERDLGGDRRLHEALVREQIERRGPEGFAPYTRKSEFGIHALGNPVFQVACVFIGMAWFLMMAFQGEGMELDYQRRRHPMWEWLFSHPIHPAAGFFAEMLSPLVANPVFLCAPVFWIIVLMDIYQSWVAIPCGLAIGAAMGLAAGCFGKMIEILAMLRLSPRSRGAVLGFVSWLGYLAFVGSIFALGSSWFLGGLAALAERVSAIAPVTFVSWMFGVTSGGGASCLLAVGVSSSIALGIAGASAWISGLATRAGLAGGFGPAAPASRFIGAERAASLGRDPLWKKELLWFWRDRGAIVQAVLIPLSIGAIQAYNFRKVAASAGDSWNNLCGLALIFGTYFLLILGPRSLVSEGGALWLSLTWPRGLESLLKAKARLWWLLASLIVGLIMIVAMVKYPADWWKISLVIAGWIVFGRSLAEKTVTLVGAPSGSGEPEPVPPGRRWAAMLGTLSFATGVLTQNWHVAALGVIFSTLTAAAMWQNFRSRLPYLYDPWSERLPPAPSLMHAMVSITAMLEGMALFLVPLLLVLGSEGKMVASSLAYGLAGLLAWVFARHFLAGRGVRDADIWRWGTTGDPPASAWMARLANGVRMLPRHSEWVLAIILGVALGLLGVVYTWVIHWIPAVRGQMEIGEQMLAANPWNRVWLGIGAVVFAPLAEEYLFRGLLYRALDREWGGGKGLLWSTLFFTVYHPPLSWIPVFIAGVSLALLFRTTGRLLPCVLVHAIYNLTITMTT